MKFFDSLLFQGAVIILMLAVSFYIFAVPVRASAPTDFVSCWDLEEANTTRQDASANNNDLTDVNTVATSTGIVLDGADFERSNSEYLTIADASQTGLDITGDISFATWFKPESQPPSGNAYMLASKWVSGSGAYNFSYFNVGGTPRLAMQLFDSTDPANNINYFIAQTLSDATWYHLVWVFDIDTDTVTVYVNGSSIGTVSTAIGTINNSSGQFTLGQYQLDPGYYTDGVMDVAEIYNRELTSAEVTALYNSGAGVACAGRGGVPETPVFPAMRLQGDMSIGGDVIIDP